MPRHDLFWALGIALVAVVLGGGVYGIDHGLGHPRHIMGTVVNRHMAPQSTQIQVLMRHLVGDRYFLDIRMPTETMPVRVSPEDFFQIPDGTAVDVAGVRGEISGWFFPNFLKAVHTP